MTTILEFPNQRASRAVFQKDIDTLQNMETHTPHPITYSIIALMEQIQRDNAAIATYMAEPQEAGLS